MQFIDVEYGKLPDQKLDIYLGNNNKTIIYIHGGGLKNQTKDKNGYLVALIEKGYSVISVEYRKYPNAKYPDFIEDCALAFSYIKNNAKKYGYSEDMYVTGHSAGAYIALMLLFDEKYLARYNLTCNDFKGYVIDSPQPTVHFNVLEERGIETNAVRIDEASPIYHLKKYAEFPKMLLITYENDMFGRKEQNLMFSKTMQSYEIPHEFMILSGRHCSAIYISENYPEITEIRLIKILEDFTR